MNELVIYRRPLLQNPSLVVGFTGWMDGGSVSVGTVVYLRDKLKAQMLAQIEPYGFYIFNMPGDMEEVAQFRPYTQIRDGMVVEFRYPQNHFFCADNHNLVLFFGKEPNIRWREYVDNLFLLVREFGIRQIFFVGSVSGLTPHTREPRVYCSVSEESLKERLAPYGVRYSNYEGPASITTLLAVVARARGIPMVNIVVEIPMYVQATNPKGIRAALRVLLPLLEISLPTEDLDTLCDEFEKNVDKLLQDRPDLAGQIRKLEENYDQEILGDEESFREWLRRHGIDKL